MQLESIQLRDFKRFNDLSIANIPPVKLVVLTGPNGSGKSSVFDGLAQWKAAQGGFMGYGGTDPYYSRDPAGGLVFKEAKLSWHGPAPITRDAVRKAVDVRSSYRHEPDFRLSSLSRVAPHLDQLRFGKLIEQDQAVSINYQSLASRIISRSVDPSSRSLNIGQLQDELLSDLVTSLDNLFGGELQFVDIGDPLGNGTFFFRKGAIARFPYVLLSGGEKAAFDLILDLCIKRQAFTDTVYCIDEPEAHMSTRLQAGLLGELVRLIPENCQLWIATHSIGMMRKAKDLYVANPRDVAFIDFTGQDFDNPTMLRPVVPDKKFWRSVLSVALDDLADLVVPQTIVVCEGNPRTAVAGKNQEHDARCYDAIFGPSVPDADFVAAGNSTDVQTDRLAIMGSLKKLAHGVNVIPLIDRDDHSPGDVTKLKSEGYRVLGRRNLQSYLYDDEVLAALCNANSAGHRVQDLLQIKQNAVSASVGRSNPPDDLKKASGEIMTKARTLLQLHGQGNDTYALERNLLAPLIVPGMNTYQELKLDIFG